MCPADVVLFWWCALSDACQMWICLLWLMSWFAWWCDLYYSFQGPHKPTRARLVGKDASLMQSPPTLPSHHRHHFLPLAFVPLTAPTPRPTLHPLAETRATPRSVRHASHLWQWDLEEDPAAAEAATTTTTRGWIQRRRRLGGGIQPRGRREDKDVAVSRQRCGVEIPLLW
jgi:hypothetical protein